MNTNDIIKSIENFASDHMTLAFFLFYLAVAFIIFLIAFTAMLIKRHHVLYSIGWSAAVGILLPMFILGIIMFISSIFAVDTDEDGETKHSPDVKNAAVGALGILVFGKMLIECPPKAGAWMLRKFDQDAYRAWLIKNDPSYQASVNAVRSKNSVNNVKTITNDTVDSTTKNTVKRPESRLSRVYGIRESYVE